MDPAKQDGVVYSLRVRLRMRRGNRETNGEEDLKKLDRNTPLARNQTCAVSEHAHERDFEQRQRGRRRERHRITEKPKSPLRMTGGKQVDVLRSGPT